MMFAMFGYENWEDLNFEESWLLVVFSLLGFFFFFKVPFIVLRNGMEE